MAYSIEYLPGAELPESSIAILRDSHGCRVATLHGEHAASNAQILSVALTNPSPLEAIQRQTHELVRLNMRIKELEAEQQTASPRQAEGQQASA